MDLEIRINAEEDGRAPCPSVREGWPAGPRGEGCGGRGRGSRQMALDGRETDSSKKPRGAETRNSWERQ